jgi:hypothetical protein
VDPDKVSFVKQHIPKIVSGGQTGADRVALDWVLSRGIECGGWCPEEGAIAALRRKEVQRETGILWRESGRRKRTDRILAPTGSTPNCIRVLVERDSVSGPGSHVQNSPVNRPGASFVYRTVCVMFLCPR